MITINKGDEKKNPDDIPNSDKTTIVILFLLYVLQGIPLGLTESTKFLLQNKNVTYKEQALFSLADWPFSIKLLWAPIVDSVYWSRLGRRKSWLIPAQTLLGIAMFMLSNSIFSLLGENGHTLDVLTLTIAFFGLNFLSATQDIAVDGWALSMLSRQNVGYASICNLTGQTLGCFIGNVVFLVLESPEFCNQYFRHVPQPYGLITISGFLRLSGVVFLVATFTILIFKPERKENHVHSETLGITETYSQLYHILCLKNVLLLVSFLLTFQVATSTVEAVTKLKFIEAGVSKEKVALLSTPESIINIVLPFYIASLIVGAKPMNFFLKAFPYKLLFGFIFAFLIWLTPSVKLASGIFPSYYYVMLVLCFFIHQGLHICMHLPITSFFNKISDESIGGTYMTLMNTCMNLGYSWSSSLAILGVDLLTFKQCDNSSYGCNSSQSAAICTSKGHKCLTILDGYNVEIVICTVFGFIWMKWGKRVIHQLHTSSASEWKTYLQLENEALKP